MKEQTGIEDDEELKAHVMRVAREGYDICECACFMVHFLVRMGSIAVLI